MYIFASDYGDNLWLINSITNDSKKVLFEIKSMGYFNTTIIDCEGNIKVNI